MQSLAKIFMGTFGSGKTYNAIKAACDFIGEDNSHENFMRLCNEKRIAYIPLSPNFTYENFVAGVKVSTDAKGKITYQVVDKVFSEMCEKALMHKDLNYCVILDDLDRVNISVLLGELINAIEYRNERVTTTSGKSIMVPDNLLIVGTLNSLNQRDTDYAVLRRFNLQPLNPTKQLIYDFYEGYPGDVVETVVEFYEKVNSFIDLNISTDYLDLLNEYHISPAFYLKSKASAVDLLNVIVTYIDSIIIPILHQYVSDGILDCSFDDVKSFQASLVSMRADIQSASVKKITKWIYNYDTDSWASVDNCGSDAKDEYIETLHNELRGYKAELFRLIFEAVSFSNIVPVDSLFNDIYNNTNLIKVSNQFARSRDKERLAAFVAEESVSEQFQYSTQGGKINCSVYATVAVGNKMKPRYEINGKRYVIASGFRSGGSTTSLDTYEPTLLAPLYHGEFVYKLIVSYYNLMIRGFAESGNNLLEKLAKVELNYVIKQERIAETWPEIIPNLSILWSSAGSEIHLTSSKIDDLERARNSVSFTSLYEDYVEQEHNETLIIPSIGVENMSNDYKKIMDLLNIHQMILQGPPGTSKTYGAKEFIGNRIIEKGDATGLPMSILTQNQLNEEHYNENIELDKSVYWDIVQFHPSYDYEDFVRGIDVRPGYNGIEYVTVNKTLGKIAALASKKENSGKEFYLIIDEINRANIASVFGELIYALEYRGEPVETPYAVNGESTISLPSNLYIIGTMNTADKSIGNIDYAVKRRFIFFNSLPNRETVLSCAEKDENAIEVRAYDIVAQLFRDYLNSEYNIDDVQLGHTYFLRVKESPVMDEKECMFEKMRYQIIPILREYFKDGILENNEDSGSSQASQELMSIIEQYSVFKDIDKTISDWLNKHLN